MEKINVLYVCIDPSLGGSTASLFNMIEGLKDGVHSIVLFPELGTGVEFFKKHGIECYVYPFIGLHEFRRNKIVDVWHHPWRWHYIKKVRIDVKCAIYMWKQLKGRRIDIVHTNTGLNNVGIYLARLLHAKHIWHVRECLDIHCDAQIYGGKSKLISQINRADARIAVSSFVAEHWQMKDASSYVVYDAARSKHDTVYDSSKEKFVLFVSYYITEQKGSRRAIEAFGRSRLSDDGYVLRMVGNCSEDYKQSLLETAVLYSCERNVEFIPVQSDVKPYYVKASVFIMSSKAEGLSRVVSESMFFGCPVLASCESGGALDQVIDGETGYVFNTLEDCAKLLRKVCLTNQEHVIMRAQEFAKNNLSIEVYGPKIMAIYRNVLSR